MSLPFHPQGLQMTKHEMLQIESVRQGAGVFDEGQIFKSKLGLTVRHTMKSRYVVEHQQHLRTPRVRYSCGKALELRLLLRMAK